MCSLMRLLPTPQHVRRRWLARTETREVAVFRIADRLPSDRAPKSCNGLALGCALRNNVKSSPRSNPELAFAERVDLSTDDGFAFFGHRSSSASVDDSLSIGPGPSNPSSHEMPHGHEKCPHPSQHSVICAWSHEIPSGRNTFTLPPTNAIHAALHSFSYHVRTCDWSHR